ncbi:MAG: hypothetical protein SFV17_03935 [Candidatus Obscuribacter sp.]|nr:hypothetical protein [Candidatus Melainabacteria bacterium]MDX1985818.1 hypothetical protein [Candidatus Obscuribacter sp.]
MGRDIDDEKPAQKIEQAQPREVEKNEPLNLLDLTQAGADQSLAKNIEKPREIPNAVQEHVTGLSENMNKYMEKLQGANPEDMAHYKQGLKDTLAFMADPNSKWCGGGAYSHEQVQQLSKSLDKS